MTNEESRIVHAAIAVSISAQRIGFGSFDKIPSAELHEMFGAVNEYLSMQEQVVNFKDVVSALKKNWPWFKFSSAALAEYLGIEYIP